jgi:hypothetical protein
MRRNLPLGCFIWLDNWLPSLEGLRLTTLPPDLKSAGARPSECAPSSIRSIALPFAAGIVARPVFDNRVPGATRGSRAAQIVWNDTNTISMLQF